MSLIIIISLLVVTIVLCMGLFNMMRNGSSSRSQNLMRWRVGLQFAAIIVIMTALYLGAR
jgi:glycerol uptake facilitator-like aquaporin